MHDNQRRKKKRKYGYNLKLRNFTDDDRRAGLFIESAFFLALRYLVKDNHIIVDGSNCGMISIAMENVDDFCDMLMNILNGKDENPFEDVDCKVGKMDVVITDYWGNGKIKISLDKIKFFIVELKQIVEVWEV